MPIPFKVFPNFGTYIFGIMKNVFLSLTEKAA